MTSEYLRLIFLLNLKLIDIVFNRKISVEYQVQVTIVLTTWLIA